MNGDKITLFMKPTQQSATHVDLEGGGGEVDGVPFCLMLLLQWYERFYSF